MASTNPKFSYIWRGQAKPGEGINKQDGQKKGEFVRGKTAFHDYVSHDGSSGFPVEKDRYHLYVAWACPWAHRALLARKLKGLEDVIGVTTVDWLLEFDKGWRFTEEFPDDLYGSKYLREIYDKCGSSSQARVTVPVLWDKKKETIVNNESSEIIRILNAEFNSVAKNPELDLYPESLRDEIDEVNEWVYRYVNNGVYRCGFATTQEAYEDAAKALFESLDKLEERLEKKRYLVGNQLTEADIRLFATLYRFDPVYSVHFKASKKKLIQYPNLYGYVCDIYQQNGVKETMNLEETKKHYYGSHRSINPHGIIPIGPEIDYERPHHREKLK